MKQDTDTEDTTLHHSDGKIIGRGYRVPDAYFSDLAHKIEYNAQQEARGTGSIWLPFLRMAGFTLGFGLFVVVGTIGFKFITNHMDSTSTSSTLYTLSSTTQSANITASGNASSLISAYDDVTLISLYDISEEDIVMAFDESDGDSNF